MSLPLTVSEAERIVADYFRPQIQQHAEATRRMPIVEWAEKYYYIPEAIGRPIKLYAPQPTLLRFLTDSEQDFTTMVWSQPKKSGKTAVSGVVGRYTAENSGPKAEVYFIATSKEQAKDRAYESAKTSIELDPNYNKKDREIPGQWKVIERHCEHLKTGSLMRAIATDYEGAAGGNPNGTFWTELWALTGERMKRLWDEMTPVPTRERSIRWVETYAGFEDESEILYKLYELGKEGTRITAADLEKYGGWPFPDPPPLYVNRRASLAMYWDEGQTAQRMPWQTSERGLAYYREQESTLRKEAFLRLHHNLWVSSLNPFMPLQWWMDRRRTPEQNAALRKYILDGAPCVLGVDASVSGACTAVVGVCRSPWNTDHVSLFRAHVWKPSEQPGNIINLTDVEYTICALKGRTDVIPEADRPRFTGIPALNVVQVSYDEFQLHEMMTRLYRDGIVWTRKFSQAADREIGDKQLYDMIRDGQFNHDGEFAAEYITNASAYTGATVSKTPTGAKNKTDRLRIVAKTVTKPVDPLVATSMAVSECKRLLLD